jgi:hypothetical protein
MDKRFCLACGGKLRWRSNREATCPNADCPEGGRFGRCGFCGMMSFAVSKESDMRCINPGCTLHDRRRKVCPDCRKASSIPWKRETVCINRNCLGNRDLVAPCFFCGERSFLDGEGLMFCAKGGCSALLEEMRRCDACGEMSFSLRTGACRNRKCDAPEAPEKSQAEGEETERDGDLDRLVALWPKLPPPVREAIRVLAENARQEGDD